MADSLAVIVKSEILRGRHIYAYVPENQPYFQLDPILETPATLQPAGGWSQTPPTASVYGPGVLIYNDTAVFIRMETPTLKLSTKQSLPEMGQALLYTVTGIQFRSSSVFTQSFFCRETGTVLLSSICSARPSLRCKLRTNLRLTRCDWWHRMNPYPASSSS